MGDQSEINLVPLGFSFKEHSNQIKNSQVKNDVSSTLKILGPKTFRIWEPCDWVLKLSKYASLFEADALVLAL